MILNINTNASVVFANILEKCSKSALPVAVRTALNSTAFDTKKNSLPKSAARNFENRNPNFFKANSRVEMASGFKINSMQSVVGMSSQGLKGSNNYAVKDLQQQEQGGTIKSKSFIPLEPSRVGNKSSKPVRANARLSAIKKIVDARNARGVSDKQKFVKSVAFAGKGGYVLSKFKGKMILWRVNSLNKTSSGQFKLTALYSYEENRSVHVKPTAFMKEASMESIKKMETFFIQEAEKQINKIGVGLKRFYA